MYYVFNKLFSNFLQKDSLLQFLFVILSKFRYLLVEHLYKYNIIPFLEQNVYELNIFLKKFFVQFNK